MNKPIGFPAASIKKLFPPSSPERSTKLYSHKVEMNVLPHVMDGGAGCL